MARTTILVTGGAGYIGSHAVLALQEAGYQPVVIDNLSTGDRRLIPAGVPFVHADVADTERVLKVLHEHEVDAVLHFAGSIVVADSVREPLDYYANNTCASRSLIEACVRAGVGRFVFSSTAAVYGAARVTPIPEDTPTEPANPYGASKLMTEWILRDVAHAENFSYVALRYFNVAGADPAGRAGQSTPVATHLIKCACQAAVGRRPQLVINGTDYATPDGTCIRDYIHVSDLADAHVLAVDHLLSGGESAVMNCGYGRGYSVRQIAEMVERVAGRPLNLVLGPRRPGDVPELVADPSRIRAILGWRPRHDRIEAIIRSALNWEQRLVEETPLVPA